ncbi:Multidrug resistance protein stp [Mycobacterium marinum]|nr:Multidrug resistance protein stp [Mycobacterium marinum]
MKTSAASNQVLEVRSWRALWAMMIGLFLVLVDTTSVTVALPRIMGQLSTGYAAVIWVTSAYLLAYAVPLLAAGRLGDQFGPKNLYLIGLGVFTAASVLCGLAGSIEMLIAARAAQGLGAAAMAPQTLSIIIQIFPPERRGVAISIWGANSGLATLAGPLIGGLLVQHFGWRWIFLVNLPIGVIGFMLVAGLVPALPTHQHHFDLLGVALSGITLFLIVFALQESYANGWALWIWAMIAAGVVALTVFAYSQSVNEHEPLVPPRLFLDRNFSLALVGIAVVRFTVTATLLPAMFYAQLVCDLSPARAALLMVPMGVCNLLLAPVVGRIIDRSHPRPVVGFGFLTLAIALTWLSVETTPTTPIWRLVLPIAAIGVGTAFLWTPLATTATRNLPAHLAGAGSGVFTSVRQVGAVLGSASMAAFMTARIYAENPTLATERRHGEDVPVTLPSTLHDSFAAAMSQSMLLPACVALLGITAALFLLGTTRPAVAVQ